MDANPYEMLLVVQPAPEEQRHICGAAHLTAMYAYSGSNRSCAAADKWWFSRGD